MRFDATLLMGGKPSHVEQASRHVEDHDVRASCPIAGVLRGRLRGVWDADRGEGLLLGKCLFFGTCCVVVGRGCDSDTRGGGGDAFAGERCCLDVVGDGEREEVDGLPVGEDVGVDEAEGFERSVSFDEQLFGVGLDRG